MEEGEVPRPPPKPSPTPDEQSVAKANEAIAIRPKRGRLTLLSRRIYNALLYHSQRQGVDEPVYKLALSPFGSLSHQDYFLKERSLWISICRWIR